MPPLHLSPRAIFAALAVLICLAISTPASAAVVDEERIEFEPGTDNATRDGVVAVGVTDRWILHASAGQVMDLTIDSADENTVFSVFAPDRAVLATISEEAFWTGVLPTSGDYAMEVTTVDGSAYYLMKVWINAEFRDPMGLVQRMTFAPGTDSGTAGSSVVRASFDTWLLRAAAGQTMDPTVTSI